MPKLRSKGSVKKRFKVTGGGKIKRATAFHRHNLAKKNSKRKRNLSKCTLVSKHDEKKLKKIILT